MKTLIFYFNTLYFKYTNKPKQFIFVPILILFMFFSYYLGYKHRDNTVSSLKYELAVYKDSVNNHSDYIEYLNSNLTDYHTMLRDGDYYRYMAFKHSNIRIPKSMDKTSLKLIHEMSIKHHVPIKYVYRLIWRESRYKPNVTSSKGARGYMQIMPGTYKTMKNMYIAKYGNSLLNKLDNHKQNIVIGIYYLSYLKNHFGNWTEALSSYNAGPQSSYSSSVKHYVSSIMY